MSGGEGSAPNSPHPGAKAPPSDAWTEAELATLRSLWIGSLPPAPDDPSNAYDTDPRAARLGRAIFFDTRFSANGAVSCGTCHVPQLAFQDARPRGRGIMDVPRRTMTLVDVFAAGSVETADELIRRAVVLAWERGLEAASISVLESSPWIPGLKRAGFRERETSPIVVYASPKAGPEVNDERSWLLLHGDRDS